MRDGWSLKAAGLVLGIAPTKIPQAIDPAFCKVAKLLLADPAATLRELMRHVHNLERDLIETEINARTDMLNGRR